MSEKHPNAGGPGNVYPLFPPDPNRDQPTPEELAEYRRMLPLLRQLLADWEALKSKQGCPVFHRITMSD